MEGEAEDGSLGSSSGSSSCCCCSCPGEGGEEAPPGEEEDDGTAATAPVGLSSTLFPGPSFSTAATTTLALPRMTSLTAPVSITSTFAVLFVHVTGPQSPLPPGSVLRP